MTDPGHSVRLRISGRTDTGQVRDNNEDSIHVWSRDDWLVLAVVADGMGGAVAGEEASRIAIETVRSGLGDALGKHLISTDGFNPDSLSPHLKESIQDANLNIVERARRNPELKGMGTTITLALIREMNLIIGHVGDSRAYLIHDDGDINQITADHSFVQALVAAGHITEDEAEEHPMRNVLYRALGQASDVEVDIYSQHLSPNDRLVLCSDGLTLHLKAREIAEVVLRLDDPEDASNELVEMANARGGRDNISVIVVKVE
ncbi:MAG: Stp1/IreP family PP2C-type Ser/Thr phosphatase, partial [Chloroflexota bacterium]